MRHRVHTTDGFGVALGFFSTMSQVILMREALGIVGGNELVLALGFAVWFAGVGLGAGGAALLPPGRRWVLSGAIAGPLLVLLGMTILRLHRLILEVPVGADPSLLGLVGVAGAGLGAGGLAAGFLFTAAARNLGEDLEAPVSRLYGTEAVGALLGGLVFTFGMAGRIPHPASICIAGGGLIAIATLTHPGRWAKAAAGLAALATLVPVMLGETTAVDRWLSEKAIAALHQGTLEDIQESPYGRIALLEREGQQVLLVDGQFHYAFPDPWERPIPVHLALTQHPRPRRVLLLGGGPSDRLEAALAHRPDRVVLTYLDHRIHDLCRPFWSRETSAALADRRVEVVLDDGRRFLSRTRERFDVVLVSAPPPLSAGANRYHTVEFYRTVARAMPPDGVMTVIAPGGANVLAPEAARVAASAVATVRSVFPEVVLVPGLETLIHATRAKGVLLTDPSRLEARYETRRVDARSFSPYRFESIYIEERRTAVSSQLALWPDTVNTDDRPAVYLANLQLQERNMGTAQAAARTLTGSIEGSAWWWLALPFLLAVSGWAPLPRYPISRYRSSVVSITTTGAAGMAAEILILYRYQASQGTLYVGIALITALFMAGLALGAFLGRGLTGRFVRGRGEPTRLGGLSDALVILFLGATAPVLAFSDISPLIPGGWSLFAGVVTGAAFPVFLRLAARSRRRDERSAAAVMEGADHLGAGFGALVTGIVWLPVFGVTVTCWMFIAFKVASLAGQLFTAKA